MGAKPKEDQGHKDQNSGSVPISLHGLWEDISALSRRDQPCTAERADEATGGDLLVLWVEPSGNRGNPVSIWSLSKQDE